MRRRRTAQSPERGIRGSAGSGCGVARIGARGVLRGTGPARPDPTTRPSLHGSVGPSVYDSSVGRIFDLEAWRQDHRLVVREVQDDVAQQPLRRLERAIRRLDGLVARGTGRISSRVESELLAIMGAVTAGRPEEAAERAERLAERLEHPSARAQ